MLSVLGHLLPIAIAAAVSTIPITATIVILLSPNRDRSAVPFLIGWVLGMAAVVTVAVLGARVLPVAPARAPNVAIGMAEIVVGVGILVLAAATWRSSTREEPPQGPSWLDKLGALGPAAAFGSGIALNLRPKGLLLAAAAGLAIVAGDLAPVATVLAMVGYLVVATSTVAGPIVAALVAPGPVQPRLEATREWLVRHRQVVTALVMLFAGVAIIGSGFTRL